MPVRATVLASLARTIWRLAEDKGLDAEFIFRESGMDPALVNQPRSRYPRDRLHEALVRLSELTKNPNIGLQAAKYYHPFDLHALGVTFLSSSTLLEALNRLDRYETILSSNVDYSIITKDDRVDFIAEVEHADGQGHRIAEDIGISVIIDLCRKGVGGDLDPLEVAMSYPRPDDISEYISLYRSQIRFGSKIATISFAKEDLGRPFTAANRELAFSNDQILDDILKDLRKADIVSKVKQAIVQKLPSGTPTEGTIAKMLFVSSRTLSRKLATNGRNFRQLLKDVRLELAKRYVSDPTVPITEISYRLGFSDVSSFSRAFKRWIGEPPIAYRANIS